MDKNTNYLAIASTVKQVINLVIKENLQVL